MRLGWAINPVTEVFIRRRRLGDREDIDTQTEDSHLKTEQKLES
jgi:hypothetical protein